MVSNLWPPFLNLSKIFKVPSKPLPLGNLYSHLPVVETNLYCSKVKGMVVTCYLLL